MTVQVKAKVSVLFSVPDVTAVSKHIVPPLDAVNIPAFWKLCVPLAVNVFDTV